VRMGRGGRVRSAGWRRIAGAVISGLLLAASFPRIGQPWVAWLALVPLLAVIRGVRPRAAAGLGWITGLVFFVTSIYWIPNTISSFTDIPHALAVLVLLLMAAAAAYAHALFAFGVEWLARGGVPRMLGAPIVWVFTEWMRTFVVAEFPWNLLGYSQVFFLTLIQAADLGGVYLISAVIVFANASLASGIVAWQHRRWGSAPARFALAAAAPAFLFVYGQYRLSQLDEIPYSGSLRIGIVQGNIAQDQKWDQALQDAILAKYLGLTDQAAEAGAQLVVWPEAAVPFYMGRDIRTREILEKSRELGIDMLVGAPGLDDRGDGMMPWNDAWLVRSEGEVMGPYAKIQLVPFGEYIPLYGLFGMVEVAVEAVGQLGRGKELTIFETKPVVPTSAGGAPVSRPARFATLICYEGIFPKLTRAFANEGPDFLVNISNDAWYGDTAAPHQHLEMAAMRSVENRLPLVRATNTGISAFVTDEGSIGGITPLFHEDVVVETVLMRNVWSFYREFGDVFLHCCQALVAVLALFVVVRGRRRVA
jgi:apolipoprotein N-acyltransferase